MILKNERSVDDEDVGALFHALIRFMEANAECMDRTIAAVGYANLMNLAKQAAEQVALLHDDEGGQWDGVFWDELLCAIDENSLAAGLLATEQPDVTAVVVKWLLSFGYVEISHAGERWSFDGDELSVWDEEVEGFHFLTAHPFADPTVESVTQFIDQLNYSR